MTRQGCQEQISLQKNESRFLMSAFAQKQTLASVLFEAILSRSVLPTRFAVSTVLPSVLQQGVINGYINDRRTYGVNLHRISD